MTKVPQMEPLSLPEAKQHLRIDDDQLDDDALIQGLIVTARRTAEDWTGRAFMTQTWTLYRDAWPAGKDEGLSEGWSTGAFIESPGRALALPKPPLQSVVHVKTYDDSDTATTWAASNYFVDTASEPGRLVARVGQTFPTTARTANGIEIQFKAGYGDSWNDVPEAIRQGMLLLIAHLYENREHVVTRATVAAVPLGIAALWQSHRIMRL